MLLLLPKNFSSEFRENWETYRTEYWDRENERRAALRRKVRMHRRSKAKEIGGWKWWTGFWRFLPSHRTMRRPHDLEKHPHHAHLQPGSHSRQHSTLSEKDAAAKVNRRRSLMRSDSTHSRQSSRSTTPHLDFDGVSEGGLGLIKKEKNRRGSSVSSTASSRKGLRKDRTGTGGGAAAGLSPLTAADGAAGDEKSSKREKRRSRPDILITGSPDSVVLKTEPLEM